MDNLDEVLRLMLAHRDSCHPRLVTSSAAGASDADKADGALCYAIQTKTRKLLPKIMRNINGLRPNEAIKKLEPLCKLLSLLLKNEICPYYSVAFQAPATILFYLIKFLSQADYAMLHDKLMDVCIELALLMQQSDVAMFLHLFYDISLLLDDLNVASSFDNISEAMPIDIYCFMSTSVHIRKDNDTMVNNVKICCIPNSDEHAGRIVEIGKLIVPPLRFPSKSSIMSFQTRVFAFANGLLNHSPTHIGHHTSYTLLRRVVVERLEQTPPVASLYALLQTMITQTLLPQHAKVELFGAFLSSTLTVHNDLECMREAISVLKAISAAITLHVMPMLWNPLESFIQGVLQRGLHLLHPASFLLVRSFFPMKEDRTLQLLLDLAAGSDISQLDVRRELVLTMRNILNENIASLWKEGEKAIHQFYPASPSSKRYKRSEAFQATNIADLVNRVRSRQLSPLIAWIHLTIAFLYDDSLCELGCQILLPLRSASQMTKEEGSMVRLIVDRLKGIMDRAPTVTLALLLYCYLSPEDLAKIPIASFLQSLGDAGMNTGNPVLPLLKLHDIATLMQGKHDLTIVQNLIECSSMEKYVYGLCWMHYGPSVHEASWEMTAPSKFILAKVPSSGPLQALAVHTSPLLAFVMSHSGLASIESTQQTILELLLPLLENPSSDVVKAVLGSIGRLFCVQQWINSSSIGRQNICDCVVEDRLHIPQLSVLWPRLEPHLSSPNVIVDAIKAWIALFRHLPIAKIHPEWVWRYLNLLGHDEACVRTLIIDNIPILLLSDSTDNTPLGAALAAQPSSDELLDTSNYMSHIFDRLLEHGNTSIVASTIAAMGKLASACVLSRPLDLDVFFYHLFRLAAMWQVHSPASVLGVSATTHLNDMVKAHNMSWKQLCVQFPERIHSALIELLLPKQLLERFLHTFLGSNVSVAIYLKECAPYVLPHLILNQNRQLLDLFCSKYEPKQSISSLLGEFIVPIVKEMVMTRTKSLNNIREWQFFFDLLRPDLSIRDVLKYNPLRLLYELVWEFSGERSKVARNAFDQVSKLLHEEETPNAKFHLPQQYFLALMTHLGNKIVHKSSRLRSIQCLEVLLAMFDTKGMLDPFVPKVMATLKLALQDEADVPIKLAACRAWHTFVQLLSTSAIETNLLSITASLLPCVGSISSLFEAHVSNGSVWCAARTIESPAGDSQVHAMAIQILNYLFVEQPIKPSWGQVALLLSLVPSFKIEAVSSFAIDHHPLDGVLTHVLALLKHWDSVVREVGLLHLTRLLCTRSRELQDLILMAEGIAHASVFNVLQALLSLSRTETNENVKALCAQSLGALGAIDLGRLPLRLSRPATNELSTKDLTCVLIEKLLVNELRAAPQNTDLIALSIQELLKFLAGLRIDPTAPTQDGSQPPVYAMSASMPDWMQRRFHQTKVLQIIAPYWSTKYKAPPSGSKSKPIVDDEDGYTTFYDTYGAVAYEKWLTSWCKSLIDLSSPPEKTVFLACRTALGISTQMARFLLPYLVQNVLKRRDAYSSVKREIDSVLQDDQSESDVVSSHHHQCAQTVLSMLDTLNDWIWTHQRRRQAASQQASKSASVNDDITDQEKEVVEEFLKDISPAMLSAAACKIKAYARGIQYYETHLRQSGVSPVPTYSKDGKAQIKSMTLNDIRELQSMYGQLDEPDALRGLSVQRALLMGSSHAMTFPDLMHTIIDHEHLARWEDALACYEQAIHRTHGNEVDLEIRSLLYAGVIRCMVQLGRLEGALQHVRGIVVESPDVIPSVYPFALECAWRLSRWNLLQELTTDAMKVKLESQHMVSMKFARTMLCLQQNTEAMAFHLKEARLAIMGPLAAASLESYQRVYPLLHQLHVLHELEQGFLVLDACKNNPSMDAETQWLAQCPWELRDRILAPALKYQEPLLALRRVMLQEMQLSTLLSKNWLRYAKTARKEGFARTAESAVMHAQALGHRHGIIEKAKLLEHQGKIYEALHVLEPVPIDVTNLPEVPSADHHFAAKTLLLATNYMQQSNQKQGQVILDRYGAVIAYDRQYAKGYFDLAKYYEVLLDNARSDTTQDLGDQFSYATFVLQNYVLSLQCSAKYLFQSLPRLLTLWYECGDVFNSAPKQRTYRLEFDLALESNKEERLMQEITRIVYDALAKLPVSMWLACLPQVASRICHPNQTVVDGVKAIMVKVLSTYPQQAMWTILGLTQSLNTQRKSRAMDILKGAQKQLHATNHADMANALSEATKLVEDLIKLAEFDPGNQRKMAVRITRIRSHVLVPIQSAFTKSNPVAIDAKSSSIVYIKAFADKADVMPSKEKPKRVQILGSDGQWYTFLCKREKHGDLRKDARMMEFNAIMNKLLQADADGRRRKLRLRTYAVMCLNEESGLMEWVQNTRAMRALISQIVKTEMGFVAQVRLPADVRDNFINMQKQYAHDIPRMVMYYRSRILNQPVFTPRFHQWFLNNFSDPTTWFEARAAFTRSSAVWSMVGHIVGLGDRHGENILIDCTTGECVHVDFDCLFDKGLKLARPEIVPFRLTPNVVDAFGLSGVEGVYRSSCEVALTLLRANRETLRSVLESFVHDPLVEWGRSKSKQAINPSTGVRAIATANEQVNREAKTMLKTIDDRVRGIWNLGKAQHHETLPLSVKGQVDRLIAEATSDENLAQMYVGWMPFL